MKITIKFPNASRAVVRGNILEGTPIRELKRIYEAERAINELTTLRCHIFVDEDHESPKEE